MYVKQFMTYPEEKIRIFFRNLKKDFSRLGPHYKPLIENLEEDLPRLLILYPHIDISEDVIRAIKPLQYIRDFFKIQTESPRKEREKLIKTYFILHFLIEVRAWAKELAQMRTLRAFTHDVYRQSLLSFRMGWIALVRSYLRVLTVHYSADVFLPFALANVGSLSDQDDVDLCTICLEDEDKETANSIITKINNTLTTSGLIPHHYLSNAIGNYSYALSHSELLRYLDENRGDFVVISQLLGSYFVAGDHYIYNRFEDEVLERFYFSDPTLNYYHENFLFSAVSEINVQLNYTPQKGYINPKESGYRLIRSLVTSLKSIFRIKNKSIYQTIYELSLLDVKHDDLYVEISRLLTFFDVFRMTYQVAISAQTDISLDKDEVEELKWTSQIMGYKGKNCHEQLLSDYYQCIKDLHKTSERLLENVIINHLKGMSIGYAESLRDGWLPDSKFLYAFFNIKDDEAINSLVKHIETDQEDPHIKKTAQYLRELRSIGSRYLKGYLDELYIRIPEHLSHLDDNIWFNKRVKQVLSSYSQIKRLDNKAELLKDYYFLEFVHLSMVKLGFMSVKDFNRRFTRFYDVFALMLLDLCYEATIGEMHDRYRDYIPPELHDNILFISTGGNGRGDSYNEDYDAVILVDVLKERDEQLFKSIISKFSTFLFQIRTRLHNFFTEEFGTILIPFKVLEGFLKEDAKQDFIYRSQILDGHVITGNMKYRNKFEDEIRKQYVFDRATDFIGKMMVELKERREYYVNEPNNIKEAPGGLRDVVMVLHMLKAYLNVSEPIPRIAIERMLEMDIPIKDALISLNEQIIEMKSLRDLYFLTVAQDNTLYFDYTEETKKIWRRIIPTGGILKELRPDIDLEVFYNQQREKGILATDRIVNFLLDNLKI